jgi:hypothetical protein
MALTLPEFIARRQAATLSERSAAQQHFLDLFHEVGRRLPMVERQANPGGRKLRPALRPIWFVLSDCGFP